MLIYFLSSIWCYFFDMVWCTVFGCSGRTGGTFHRFPRNPVIRKQWVFACQRADKFDPDNGRVCSLHFSDLQYARSLKQELLNLPERCKQLKADAVPDINLPKTTLQVLGKSRIKTTSSVLGQATDADYDLSCTVQVLIFHECFSHSNITGELLTGTVIPVTV